MTASSIAHLLDLALLVALCVILMAGFPVAFTLGGVSLVFALIGVAFGAFDITFLQALPQRIFGTITNEVMLAVPLFVFMGVMLERSRVAEALLETMGRLFGTVRGGLLIAVTFVGALLAASTGIVGATVVTMGLLSLPTMLRHGTDKRLACGSIAAAGTLGQIIPPSIVLVILGDLLSSAYQRAQLEAGNFAPETVSVGDLFAGALIPGLMLAGLYMVYQLVVAFARPEAAPAIGEGARSSLSEVFEALVPPIVLIICVLGSILFGIATPTEAASVGAVGTILLAGGKAATGAARRVVHSGWGALGGLLLLAATLDLRLGKTDPSMLERMGQGAAALFALALGAALMTALMKTWRGGVLRDVMRQTADITAMVFFILVGATLFTLVFRGLGGEAMVHEVLTSIPGGTVGAILAVMAVMFLLGFFIDFLEIVFIVVPIVAPVLLKMTMPDGSPMSPVWLGVLMAVNLQTSFLTPPFGFALFYLRGVAPAEVRTMDIYRGVIPFVLLQIGMLVVLWYAPSLATALPEAIYGR